MCTHTHTHVEHAVMAFASRCLPMAYQMRFTCPVGKAWEQHVNDASQPNYLRFRRETGGQISDGMDVNFQHESIKCCPQLNKTHKRKQKNKKTRSSISTGGSLCTVPSSLTSLPLFLFSPFPWRPLVKKMSNDHASVSTIWQLVHL